jgi:hypothetical protein
VYCRISLKTLFSHTLLLFKSIIYVYLAINHFSTIQTFKLKQLGIYILRLQNMWIQLITFCETILCGTMKLFCVEL